MSQRCFLWLGLALGVLLGARETRAQSTIYADTDRYGYTGTIQKYATLTDAQNHTNQVGPTFNVTARDLDLSFQNDPLIPSSNLFHIQTADYYRFSGMANPSEQNQGFLQIDDPGHATVTSFSGGFSNSTTFNLQVAGANALAGANFARLGPDLTNSMAPSTTAGNYLTYNLSANFTGLNPATFVPGDGLFESSGDNAGMNVTGTFSGIFQNTNSTNTSFNGFYGFNFALNNNSFVFANQGSLLTTGAGAGPAFIPSFFASDTIPEPSSLVLGSLSMGFGMILAVYRRRRSASQRTV